MTEHLVTFEGTQGPVLGILARPDKACQVCVLIVAGQPQTRVGAHRMFVDLSRSLASQGLASLRFDVGGWGDSPGEARAFEAAAEDIARAAAFLKLAVPDTQLCIWGLCDGASAAVMALPALASANATPDALFLVNPWVRSEAGLGDAMIRTYYAKRILDPDFWRRLLSGKVSVQNLILEPTRHLKAKFLRRRDPGSRPMQPPSAQVTLDGALTSETPGVDKSASPSPDTPALLIRLLMGFRGEIFTVLSGNDLTAGETESLMKRDRRWRKRLNRPEAILRVIDADHTFSIAQHWHQAVDWTACKAHAVGVSSRKGLPSAS